MKIRTDFITNSSSSSFVVSFPKRPKDIEETKEILFGDKEEHNGISTKTISEIVFRDIEFIEKENIEKEKFKEYYNNVLFKFGIALRGNADFIINTVFPGLKKDNIEIYQHLYWYILDEKNNEIEEFKYEKSEEIKDTDVIYHFKYEGDMECMDIFENLIHTVNDHH